MLLYEIPKLSDYMYVERVKKTNGTNGTSLAYTSSNHEKKIKTSIRQFGYSIEMKEMWT